MPKKFKFEHIVTETVIEVPEHQVYLYADSPSWRVFKEKKKSNVDKVKRDTGVEVTEASTEEFDDNLTG